MDDKIQSFLDKYNQKLTKIKLRVKGQKVYLRGTFPPKPHDGILAKQYELSTSLPLTQDGLRIAYGRALEIESRLLLNTFSWGDYLNNGEMGIKPVRKWAEEFEEYYWAKHEKTPARIDNYYKKYTTCFNKLPADEPLSFQLILPILKSIEPFSAKREMYHIAYNSLLNFAKIENNLQDYRTSYKPKVERIIPSDTEIETIVDSVPMRYRWTFAMLATYGLRGHELRRLDTSKLNSEIPVITVSENSKTGKRLVYPLLPEWVKRWKLWEVNVLNANRHEINGYYGMYISKTFARILDKYTTYKITPYHFRDAYAIRCSLYGIDSTVAAKWMGHSLIVHHQSYLKFFDETHHTQTWQSLKLKTKEDSL